MICYFTSIYLWMQEFFISGMKKVKGNIGVDFGKIAHKVWTGVHNLRTLSFAQLLVADVGGLDGGNDGGAEAAVLQGLYPLDGRATGGADFVL